MEGPSSRRGEVQKLFLHHSDLLEGFIVALQPDLSVTKDILHEVFLTVTDKAEEFRPATDFMAWARAIARFKVLEQVRRSRNAPHVLDPNVLEAVLADAPEAEDAWTPRREALAECLERVAPRARRILELRYSDALMAPQQIARKVSWTSGAVRVALARTRRFLHDCVEVSLAGQGG